MPKKLVFLVTLLALLPVAFASPVPAQEELEGGSVVVDGDIVLDCRIFFEALEGFRDDSPSDRISQRDYEEDVGYVRLCTERGVVPPSTRWGSHRTPLPHPAALGHCPHRAASRRCSHWAPVALFWPLCSWSGAYWPARLHDRSSISRL